MKTNEERHDEISELGVLVSGAMESMLDALTGENTCPECGAPIYQLREDDMNCPNCGVLIHFQGTIPWTDRMWEETIRMDRQRDMKRLGRPRAFIVHALRVSADRLYRLAWQLERSKLEKDGKIRRLSNTVEVIEN
jgi:uncharacterized Zn finger protein (UPF0148 family)